MESSHTSTSRQLTKHIAGLVRQYGMQVWEDIVPRKASRGTPGALSHCFLPSKAPSTSSVISGEGLHVDYSVLHRRTVLRTQWEDDDLHRIVRKSSEGLHMPLFACMPCGMLCVPPAKSYRDLPHPCLLGSCIAPLLFCFCHWSSPQRRCLSVPAAFLQPSDQDIASPQQESVSFVSKSAHVFCSYSARRKRPQCCSPATVRKGKRHTTGCTKFKNTIGAVAAAKAQRLFGNVNSGQHGLLLDFVNMAPLAMSLCCSTSKEQQQQQPSQ